MSVILGDRYWWYLIVCIDGYNGGLGVGEFCQGLVFFQEQVGIFNQEDCKYNLIYLCCQLVQTVSLGIFVFKINYKGVQGIVIRRQLLMDGFWKDKGIGLEVGVGGGELVLL